MSFFHFHLHPLPHEDCVARGLVSLLGQEMTSYHVAGVDRFTMQVTFEQVENVLSRLPRMFFEMDGSFVWRGQEQGIGDAMQEPWQIDGMVYDVGGRVSRVELKGHCSAKPFSQIIAALQPPDKLLAYCIDQGCFVRVDDLLRAWK